MRERSQERAIQIVGWQLLAIAPFSISFKWVCSHARVAARHFSTDGLFHKWVSHHLLKVRGSLSVCWRCAVAVKLFAIVHSAIAFARLAFRICANFGLAASALKNYFVAIALLHGRFRWNPHFSILHLHRGLEPVWQWTDPIKPQLVELTAEIVPMGIEALLLLLGVAGFRSGRLH